MSPPGEPETTVAAPDEALPADVAEYLASMDSVPGWFYPLDARIFVAVDGIQRRRGIRGDLLEIGAYRGKSAILLGYLARAGERLAVCDIFDAADGVDDENVRESATYYGDLQRQEFERQYRRFHPAPPEIIAAPSTEIDRKKMAARFRLVHVDGSHTYEVVRADIATARTLLAPGGVVVFDDWMQPHAAGVALAVWEEYLRGELTPLCATNLKLYATWDPRGVTAADLNAWAAAQPDLDVSPPIGLAGRSMSLYRQRTVDRQKARSAAPPPSVVKRAARAVLPPAALAAYRKMRGRRRR